MRTCTCTCTVLGSFVLFVGTSLVPACSPEPWSADPSASEQTTRSIDPTVSATSPPPQTEPPGTNGSVEGAYEATRGLFVVHEWGTLTNVVTSDGRLLPGLHHEDEDLPGFVADRLAQTEATPGIVRQKMETPVTYFYSPRARSVQVKVGFPKGIFTQWFPYVQTTSPPLYLENPADPRSIIDPWISTPANLPPHCLARFSNGPADGLLDWGSVDILAPRVSVPLPGPLGETSWGFARNTAANPIGVRVSGRAYHEKFLFYRGLGGFTLPVEVRANADGVVTVVNRDTARPLRRAFLLNVTRAGAAFASLGEVPAGGSRSAPLPSPTVSLPEFADTLRAALEQVLIEDGLYVDEARAMVDTWERSYFLTPGPRVLYLLPQAYTDQIIPLTLDPKPDRLVRTMVIRVEILTPAFEAALGKGLAPLGDAAADDTTRTAARAFFRGFGRFAEPYLARAVELAASEVERAAGEALLGEIRLQRRWAPLSAE
jgi:hypothetical protein